MIPGSEAIADEHGSAPAGCSLTEPVAGQAREGDLIFRRGNSQQSNLVSLLDSRSYSHVGLVQSTPAGLMVIHALPRERDGSGGYVKQTSLSEFLAPANAEAAALYRVADDAQHNAAAHAVDWAYEHVLRGTPFDHTFDATNPGALYCTELVWEAYRSANIDLLPDYAPQSVSMQQVRASVIAALRGGLRGDAAGFEFILPGDLAESSHMQPVAVFERDGDSCPAMPEAPVRTASANAAPRPLVSEAGNREGWHAARPQTAGSGSLWFEQSPTFSFSYLLDFDFADAQTGMGVGFSGAVMHTEDGGITWTSRNNGLPVTRIQWEGIAYGNANVATVVGSDYTVQQGRTGTVARTEDGGLTWAVQDLGNPVYSPLDVAFADADNGVIVGREGEKSQALPFILRTADGGQTWDEVLLPLPGNFFGEIAAVTHIEGDTYAAAGFAFDLNTGLGYGVTLLSTDGGVTWQEQMFETAELSSITFTDANTGFVVGNQGVIMKTDDGGQTWATLQSGSDAYLLSISCANTLECVAVGTADANTEDGRVLRTGDGGQTWTPVTSELWTQNFIRTVHHLDNDILVVGMDGPLLQYGFVLRSTDGGENWVQQDFDQIREEFYGRRAFGLADIASLDPGSTVAVGGVEHGFSTTCDGAPGFYDDAGGIFRTDDDGATWRSVTPAPIPSLNGVTFWDSDNGIAFGCGGGVLKTMDGGNTWVPRESGTTKQLRAGYALAPDVAVLVGGHRVVTSANWGPVILKTTDGGDTWDFQSVPQEYIGTEEPEGGVFYDVFFTDVDTGFAVGISYDVIRIVRTLDGGENWFAQEIGSCGEGKVTCIVRSVQFSSPQVGIILVQDGHNFDNTLIFRTADGGENWEDVTPAFLQPQAILDSVHFVDELHGAITGRLDFSNGPLIVLRTNDGGATWVPDETDIGWRGSLNGIVFSEGGTGRGLIVGSYAANDAPWSSIVLRNTGGPTFPLGLRPRNASVCEGEQVTIPVAVELTTAGDYTGHVDLFVQDLPNGVSSDLPPAAVPPVGIQWSLETAPNVTAGRHVFALTADDGMQQQAADFHLHVISPDQAPALIEPVPGASDIDFGPTLTWRQETNPGAYQVQVATDPDFQKLLLDEETAFYSYTLLAPLDAGSEYFWRVRAVHDCGEAVWSEVSSFVTADLPAGSVEPQSLTFQLAAGDSGSDIVDIVNTGVGDLIWNIETALPPAAADPSPLHASRFSGAAVSTNQVVTVPAAGGEGSLASLFGEPLPGWQPINPANGVVDCDDAPGMVINDDGTIENGYQSTSPFMAGEFILVDRFTPRNYPVSYRAVCLAWISSNATETEFDIVVFDDDGENGGPGTELGVLSVSAQDIPVLKPGQPIPEPVWFSYNLTELDLTVESGSVYIGIRKVSDSVFLAADESPDRPVGFAGGYAWNPFNGWHPIQGRFTEYRSLFVRAVEGPPTGCSDPGTVSWLEVNPDGGTTPESESTPVTVTANATGLAAGEYTANLCIRTNDHRPGHSLVVVPVTLIVDGSGPGDLLFRDRFELNDEG